MDTAISVLSIILFSKYNVGSFFKKEREKHKGDVCYIFGNGPSLANFIKKEDVNGRDLFAVNFFGNTDMFFIAKPSNYIVLDNILIGTAQRDYNKEQVEQLYDIISKVTWPMTFYYPNNGKKDIIDGLTKNKNITVCIYNMTPVSGFDNVCFWLYKKSLGMPLPQNISNAAVFCAINAGYKKIYLYGVEHSWLKIFDVDPETHRIFMNDGHFYENKNMRYFEKGEYCKWVLDIHNALKSHFVLRDYADYLGVKIINKTPASFIEAYEFEEYNTSQNRHRLRYP
ncbi:hypothetical protein EV202_12324 [Bacteroides heparinolyticus]|uniref:DUF115 domain-containing protein n=2 Tax=Prevotella heparinolytica TaxID=28113 RepID=A0A4R2LNW1_9BACE|nr:hypothetical protein EV202_12324 [Bacteroides heparinolyticus]